MPAATHTRVLKAIGLSALLHAAAFAGWQPAFLEPHNGAFAPIEVVFVAQPALPPQAAVPRSAPASASAADSLARPAEAPAAETPTTPPQAGGGSEEACCVEPFIEARADLAVLNNPKPPYPLAARRRGIEGRVVLAVHVRADGSCSEVRIRRSSGSSLLDEAARDAVRRWRFLPARHGARSVDSWVEIPIRFELER